MRKHRILFAAAGILLAIMFVLSACAGKKPEPGTDTGGKTGGDNFRNRID